MRVAQELTGFNLSYIFLLLSKIKSLYRIVYRLRFSINNLYSRSQFDWWIHVQRWVFGLNQSIACTLYQYTHLGSTDRIWTYISSLGNQSFRWNSNWSVFITFLHAFSNILKQIGISWFLLKSRWYSMKVISSQLYPWQHIFSHTVFYLVSYRRL